MSSSILFIEGDVQNYQQLIDSTADFSILLVAVHSLTANDFIL